MEDARTMGRWYIVTTMGRNAGHLALGMGVASGATVTLIPEEFEENVIIAKVADMLAGSIIKRLAMGRNHGVAILAEGIADRLNPEAFASEQVEKDSMGRVRLSDVPLGRLLRSRVRKTLEELGINVTIVDKNIGYEMRAADPIPYDVEYTRNLGYGAVRFLVKGGTGSMVVVYEGNIRAIPFVEMLEFSDGSVKVRKVDLNSEAYEVARKYMIRLETTDFQTPGLDRLAGVTNLKSGQFKEKFGYLVNEMR
jgi:6-phosphofructokinase 1